MARIKQVVFYDKGVKTVRGIFPKFTCPVKQGHDSHKVVACQNKGKTGFHSVSKDHIRHFQRNLQTLQLKYYEYQR